MQKRSVSTKGLFISVIIAVLLIIGSLFGIGIQDIAANQLNHYIIDMTDYSFTPTSMTWHAGDTVTLTFKNESVSAAGVIHELMIGRTPDTGDEGFGKTITDGFETDFFKNMKVKILSGSRVLMVQPGTAHLSGIDPKKTLSSEPPGLVQQGDQFQIVIAPPVRGENPEPGGTVTVQFKVPNKPGKWELACFQGNGQHIKDGMRATINIVE